MNIKIAVQTLSLLATWLVLQNFNVATANRPEPRGKSMESPRFANSEPPAAAYRIKKVVLDAGHGGKDPGCKGASSREKDNALAIVLKVGEMIRGAFPEVEVIFTRETDVFVELNERAAIANRNKADLFISVHCNSISKSYVKGTETYVMGLHTADHNLEVAKRENAAIYYEDNYQKNYEGYDPNSPEAHIIGSVWQSAYLEQSILFASLVQDFAASTASRENRGVKQAGFLVLREAAMPAVLVESGYLTNRSEEEFIASEEGQAQVAQAIFEAFEAYKQQMENATPVAQQQKPAHENSTAAAKPQTAGPQKNTGAGTAVSEKPKLVQTSNPVEKPAGKPTTAKPQTPTSSAKTQAARQNTATADAGTQGPFRIFLISWAMRMDTQSGQMGLLGDVQEEKVEGSYYYYTGKYNTRAEAEKMLPEIKNLGFRTAAIVSAAGK